MASGSGSHQWKVGRGRKSGEGEQPPSQFSAPSGVPYLSEISARSSGSSRTLRSTLSPTVGVNAAVQGGHGEEAEDRRLGGRLGRGPHEAACTGTARAAGKAGWRTGVEATVRR